MQKLRLIAILALISFSLLVTIHNGLLARARFDHSSSTEDAVSKWEKRVKPVLKHIPPGVTVLGYVADWDIPNTQYNVIDQDNEYTLTQYALAPRAVQPGFDHEWIIGNFTNKEFQSWLNQKLGNYQMIDIGFGIYLIHRASL